LAIGDMSCFMFYAVAVVCHLIALYLHRSCGTTKHTGRSRTHMHGHRSLLWRKAPGRQQFSLSKWQNMPGPSTLSQHYELRQRHTSTTSSHCWEGYTGRFFSHVGPLGAQSKVHNFLSRALCATRVTKHCS
jgi:hypothetical protein